MNYLDEIYPLINKIYGKDVSKLIIQYLPNYKKMFNEVIFHYPHTIHSKLLIISDDYNQSLLQGHIRQTYLLPVDYPYRYYERDCYK